MLETWKETDRLCGMRIAPSESLSLAYSEPGQVLELDGAATGAGGLFAIAAPPGVHPFELLVRRGSATGERVIAIARSTARLHARAVRGAGFPWRAARSSDCVLVAAGAGIAAICALIEQMLEERERFGRVVLVYGERDVGDLAYRARFDDWQSRRIEIIPVLSRASSSWHGAFGHVHHRLAGATAAIDTSSARAFVCGMAPMVEATRSALHAIGIADDRIHLNH
ncbi:hypothetical protein [Sandaracinus amylolyticus]|uniref:hypothetical protein n=1 Tax=Sandaracinus amylolyticus TaxID=927083 RepID=UPI001F4048F2|nr:hypothetical protein [Sandaracinus amylolyticus]